MVIILIKGHVVTENLNILPLDRSKESIYVSHEKRAGADGFAGGGKVELSRIPP